MQSARSRSWFVMGVVMGLGRDPSITDPEMLVIL